MFESVFDSIFLKVFHVVFFPFEISRHKRNLRPIALIINYVHDHDDDDHIIQYIMCASVHRASCCIGLFICETTI